MLGALHLKLFVEVVMACAVEDAVLVKRAARLTHTPLQDLVAPGGVSCAPAYLEPAVHHMAMLDDFTTPAEKLACIQDALALNTRAIERQLRATALVAAGDVGTPATAGAPGAGDTAVSVRALSSDDLLPLFIYVVTHAKLMHLHSNLVYVRTFHLRGHVGTAPSVESKYAGRTGHYECTARGHTLPLTMSPQPSDAGWGAWGGARASRRLSAITWPRSRRPSHTCGKRAGRPDCADGARRRPARRRTTPTPQPRPASTARRVRL